MVFRCGALVSIVLLSSAMPAMAAVIATYSAGGGFSTPGVAIGPATATTNDTAGGGTFTTTGNSSFATNGTATLVYTNPTSTMTTIPGTIDLGSLSFTVTGNQQIATVSGADFVIDVNFTSPPGGQALEATAAVNFGGSNGVATVLFDPASTLFNPATGPQFTITPNPNPIVLNAGQSTEITGTIAFVPEPGTMLAITFAALGLLRRRSGA